MKKKGRARAWTTEGKLVSSLFSSCHSIFLIIGIIRCLIDSFSLLLGDVGSKWQRLHSGRRLQSLTGLGKGTETGAARRRETLHSLREERVGRKNGRKKAPGAAPVMVAASHPPQALASYR